MIKETKQYNQLQTVRKVATLRSTGVRYCNETFPQELNDFLHHKQKVFEQEIKKLNRKINQYWPCCFAYYCGYICAPLTLGLSLCVPMVCLGEVEEVIRKEISRINKELLSECNLEMKLQKECCDSRLVIEQIDFTRFEIGSHV